VNIKFNEVLFYENINDYRLQIAEYRMQIPDDSPSQVAFGKEIVL
jgi:hypothetical protein